MPSNRKILIIEDDQDLCTYLNDFLQSQGFRTKSLVKGSKAFDYLDDNWADLVLLDLQLPDVRGESLCRQIKETYPEIPLIILTAKDQTKDVVKGFQIGADDYITKPFDSEELLARIKSRLKTNNSKLSLADLSLDTKTKTVKRGDKIIDLTKTEFNLLDYFLSNKHQVLSREMILTHVWGYDSEANTRVVDVYIGYLRNKIDKNYEPKLVHSVRGFGYILTDKRD